MKPTDPGKRRHQVTINRDSATTNELGEPVAGPPTTSQTWAFIRPLTAREVTANAAADMNGSHQIIILYRTTLLRTDYLTYQGRRFDIVGIIDPDEAHVELWLTCNEQRT